MGAAGNCQGKSNRGQTHLDVARNIGVGKTSLTERLGSRLGWRTDLESVADSPHLRGLYTDMRAWSFHLQVYFLGHRAEQYLEAAHDPRSVILDRSIYEGFHIQIASICNQI
jgi:deoxyadenosine/deoxycytidine kinase